MGVKRYVWLLGRFKVWIALFSFCLLGLCVLEAKQLTLKSDFKSLLPERFQSVQDLNRTLSKVGGTGSLIVAIESPNPQQSIAFAEALIAELKRYPPGYIEQIEANARDVKAFFDEHKALYLSLDDLRSIHERLERRIDLEKIKRTGLWFDFSDPQQDDAKGVPDEDTFSTEDLQSKYKEKIAQYDGYIDGYFFGEDGRLLAFVIRPPGAATGVDFAKDLVARVKASVAEVNPIAYDANMRVGFTGNVMRVQYEYQTLIQDIVSTALLCVALVACVVWAYYRRVRMIFLMAWPVLNGVLWVFAITSLVIGYVTTQTAFLGSIIIGNGINYGLILMARYLEERTAQHEVDKALEIAILTTLRGTLVSALTTAAGFAVLMLADMKGFSQFGFIGGFGMILCWLATYTLLPVFLLISESVWPSKKVGVRASSSEIPRWFSRGFAKSAWPIVVSGILTMCVMGPLLIRFAPRSLEYNFSKLKVKPSGKDMSEDATLNGRIRAILGGSATPIVIPIDRADQAEPLCEALLEKDARFPKREQMIDSCKTLESYIPRDQDEKLVILKQIRTLLEDDALNFLDDTERQQVESFKSQFSGHSISLQDLPENIVTRFRDKEGGLGKLVYVYPRDKVSLWRGKNLIRFANLIRETTLPNGEVIRASGDSVIFADLLGSIMKDGPVVTIASFVVVCLVVMLTFRTRRASVFIIGTLALGVAWMAGLIAMFHVKLNFFNFIAIPVTFGVGVDYGVNLYQRYEHEGRGAIVKTLYTTGGAILLCSVTTMIGYVTLIIARNQALVSFGWIAILGELACVFSALAFVPAIVGLRERYRS